MSPSSPCSPFAFPHLSPFLRGLTLPRLGASVKAAELWALGLCVLEGLDGCRMQTAQVPNTSRTNQGCQHPAPAPLSPQLLAKLSEGCLHRARPAHRVLQGACCCPHSCREDSCRQVRASCCLSNHLTLILGTLPTCAASPSPVSYGGICPALLKMPLGAGAPPAWGIRQTRLCFALMVTFLPCFFPVSFPSIARGTRWQNAIIPALPPPHPPAGFCPPVNFALCP